MKFETHNSLSNSSTNGGDHDFDKEKVETFSSIDWRGISGANIYLPPSSSASRYIDGDKKSMYPNGVNGDTPLEILGLTLLEKGSPLVTITWYVIFGLQHEK